MLGLVIVTGITIVVSLPSRPSGADQLSSAKAQAAQIAAEIQAENGRISDLSQQFDAATFHLQQVNAQISTTQAQLTSDRVEVARDRSRLSAQALRAYMDDGTSTPLAQAFSTDGTAAGVRGQYEGIAEGNVTTTIDQLHAAQSQLQTQETALQQQQQAASADASSVSASRSQASALVGQEQSTLNGVNANIQNLVHQQEIAQQQAQAAAASAAFNARLAQARAAQAAAARAAATSQGDGGGTSNTGGGGGSSGGGITSYGGPIPPPTPGAAGAVAAAQSQLGVPYQWGAEDPGVAFDCSGLTAWAWGQAGHPLPHYSGAQYADTVQVPLADIEPGDLLFYGPGGDEHVAMYIGGGTMIEAPYTGAVVWDTPVRTGDGFAGVGRVE